MTDISTMLFTVRDTLWNLEAWDKPQKYDPVHLNKIIWWITLVQNRNMYAEVINKTSVTCTLKEVWAEFPIHGLLMWLYLTLLYFTYTIIIFQLPSHSQYILLNPFSKSTFRYRILGNLTSAWLRRLPLQQQQTHFSIRIWEHFCFVIIVW